MSDRTLVRLARVIFVLEALMLVIGVTWSIVRPWRPPDVPLRVSEYILVFAFFSFPGVGFLITTRRPRNTIGWILLGIGFGWAATGTSYNGLLSAYESYGLRLGNLPGAEVALALDAGLWVPAIGLIGTFLILLFPDGRLPSPKWRPVAWFSAVSLVAVYALITMLPGTFADMGYPGVRNPFGIEALRPVASQVVAIVMLVPISIALCAAGLIVRFRRSRGTERQQMKWFVAAAGFVATLYLTMMVVSALVGMGSKTPEVVLFLQTAAIFAFVLIPIATGIGVLRYRLYDIDRVINLTLVYGTLTAVLVGIYVGTVFGFQALIAPVTAESDLAVAASTLAVAGLFRPVRTRVQRFIDHRFYRRKFDTQRTLEEFSHHLRDEVDLASLSSRLTSVVSDTMQPAHVSLWVRTLGTREASR